LGIHPNYEVEMAFSGLVCRKALVVWGEALPSFLPSELSQGLVSMLWVWRTLCGPS